MKTYVDGVEKKPDAEDSTKAKSTIPPMNYQSIQQIDVPTGRDGKHKRIVTQLLSDLEQLEDGRALKVPFTALPDTKENIRSALNRATRQKDMDVATSSDNEFLYIWKPVHPSEVIDRLHSMTAA